MKNVFLILGFSLFVQATSAQVAVTNTGTLFIKTSSDIFFINGDFTNNSSSALTNNGSLYIKQTLTNNQASMAVGTGTLILNGSSGQSVNGTQTFKTYKLQTNNSAGFTLNNNLSVSNVHTYSAGIITTSATPNYLIYEAGSSYTGDADSRHVNGWVKKFGNTNFTFPVGNASIERTIALNTISASSEFNVLYNGATTPNRFSAQAPLLYIDPNEWWTINQVSGGTALVAMNWNNAKVAFPPWVDTYIRVASWNGTNWVSQGGTAVGNPATTGSITSSSTISSFTRFAFGGEAFPLPLTLISFNAKRVGDHTALSWTTESEQDVDHFEAQRSDDGNNFYTVSQLPARNTNNREFYSTADNKPINHVAYYRLRMVDIDGKQKLSRIVPVTAMDGASNLVLLTNPVHDRLILAAGDQLSGSFDYSITTLTGQLVQHGRLILQAGSQYTLPLTGNFQRGMYHLLVNDARQAFPIRFVVD